MALSSWEIAYLDRLKAKWASKESMIELLKKRREKEAKMNAPEKKWIIWNIIQTGQNIGAGAIQAGGELSVGLAWQLSRLLPWDQSADPTSFYNKTQNLLKWTEQSLAQSGAETEWAWFATGKWIMNIAWGSVLAGGIGQGINALAKTKLLTQLWLKVAENAPTVAKYGSSLMQWLTGTATGSIGQRIVWWIAEGARQGLWFDLASGKAPWAWTIAWWIVWGVSPIIWAWVEKAQKLLTNIFPKSLIARWLTTPTALRNASERLSKLSDDWVIDIEKAPQWMLDKWIQWSKKEIQWQLQNIIKDSGKNKVALLTASKEWLWKVPEVKSLQKAMKSVLSKYAKITKSGKVIPTPWNEELVKTIQSFVGNKNPTAVEVETARSLLGNMQIFTKLWDFADSASKEWLQNVWVNVSKYLDKSFPWFRNYNKDIEVAMALSKAISLKEWQDSVRQLLTYTNLWMWWLWATYWYIKWWKAWALAWLALATWWKALLNNTAVTTKLAQWLSSPVFKKWLEAWTKVIWKTAKKLIPPLISKINE